MGVRSAPVVQPWVCAFVARELCRLGYDQRWHLVVLQAAAFCSGRCPCARPSGPVPARGRRWRRYHFCVLMNLLLAAGVSGIAIRHMQPAAGRGPRLAGADRGRARYHCDAIRCTERQVRAIEIAKHGPRNQSFLTASPAPPGRQERPANNFAATFWMLGCETASARLRGMRTCTAGPRACTTTTPSHGHENAKCLPVQLPGPDRRCPALCGSGFMRPGCVATGLYPGFDTGAVGGGLDSSGSHRQLPVSGAGHTGEEPHAGVMRRPTWAGCQGAPLRADDAEVPAADTSHAHTCGPIQSMLHAGLPMCRHRSATAATALMVGAFAMP